MPSVTAVTKEDLSGIAVLEELCFSEPWSEKSLGLLCEGDNFGVVICSEGRAVAYGGMTCVLDEGSITNIATHPDCRRQGYGRRVVSALIEEAEKRGISEIFLEVRVSNSAAIALYVSEGFTACGVRKNFYRHPTEDAIQMKYITNSLENK